MEFNAMRAKMAVSSMQSDMFGKAHLRPSKKEDLKDVTKDFEAIFIQKMLESMRKTVTKTKWLDGGLGEDIFTSLYDQEIGKAISQRGGLGLQNILYKSLKKDDKPAFTASPAQKFYNGSKKSKSI